MVTMKQVQEAQERRREEEKRNPLLKLNLGELVREMQIIAEREPFVLKFSNITEIEENIPHLQQRAEVLNNYKKYTAIVKELNRREEEYQSYKPEPRFG